MKNRFQVLLVISAFAVTSFVQIMQFDSFNAFAQQLELQESDVETNPNSEIGAIQLHKFSIWDKLEITTMGYLNPLGKSDKSVIYSYEFADNEDVAKALSVIFDSEIVMLVDTWYIGKIETVSSDSLDLQWRPVKLNQFNVDTYSSETERFLATNWPIPGEDSAEAYWVPFAEWASLVDRYYQQSNTAAQSNPITKTPLRKESP